MLKTIAITFAAFLVIFSFLAIGYIVQRKKIHGSCGGIAAIGLKKECDCPEPCEARKKMMREQAEKKS